MIFDWSWLPLDYLCSYSRCAGFYIAPHKLSTVEVLKYLIVFCFYIFRYFKETLITTHTGKTWLIHLSILASSGSSLGHGTGGSLCAQKYLDARRKSKRKSPDPTFSFLGTLQYRFQIQYKLCSSCIEDINFQ